MNQPQYHKGIRGLTIDYDVDYGQVWDDNNPAECLKWLISALERENSPEAWEAIEKLGKAVRAELDRAPRHPHVECAQQPDVDPVPMTLVRNVTRATLRVAVRSRWAARASDAESTGAHAPDHVAPSSGSKRPKQAQTRSRTVTV